MICATLKSDSKINNHIPAVHLEKTVFLKQPRPPRVPACPPAPAAGDPPQPRAGASSAMFVGASVLRPFSPPSVFWADPWD